MSKKTNSLFPPKASSQTIPLPAFSSKESVEELLRRQVATWKIYSEFPTSLKQEVIDFCTGKHGLKITYDPVFRKIFNPSASPNRLEAFLSAILGRNIRIVSVIPREGTQLNEQTSFVVMDVLVRLDDGSYANIEMQKIGYSFPLERADCYASDIIMRQYAQVRLEQGPSFSFQNLHKVYCIILMEKSPKAFHSVKGKYIHRRTTSFDTDIYPNSSSLHEDIFICLDSFHSIVHNITKDSSALDAWLTFLSTTDVEKIASLIDTFPCFATIYQEVADFTKKPEELMNMLSEELYIMTKNLERIMVTDLQEEVNALLAERDAVKTEKDAIEAEIDTVKTERDTIKAERDTVKTERDTVKTERDTIKAERDTVKAERDLLASEKAITEEKLQQVLAYAKAHGYQDEPASTSKPLSTNQS